MRDAEVIVIGSGLSGMSAAFRLARAGKRVLVLEARDVVGGRTSSWTEDGMPVESGIHKFLGIYRTLPGLLRDAGVDTDAMLTWVDAMELHADDARSGFFTVAPYRRPLRTIAGFLGNNGYVRPADKLRLALMGLTGLIRTARDPHGIDRRDLITFAREHGVSDRAIRDVLHALTTGVFFLPADGYSVYATMAPVLEGLKRGMTFGVGAFNGGMTDVMMRPLADAVIRLGGEVKTGSPVEALVLNAGRAAGVVTGGAILQADAVVLATSIGPAQQLIRDALGDHPWFEPMLSLRPLPAVTIQCELSSPLFDADHTHFSTTALCCFAEQVHTTFPDTKGRLSGIMYPPERYVDAPDERVFEDACAAADTLNIPLRARTERWRVVRHADDFYRLEPGAEVLRPAQATPVPGLALAGDYTKQPFLCSMEGAAISGEAAARAVLSS